MEYIYLDIIPYDIAGLIIKYVDDCKDLVDLRNYTSFGKILKSENIYIEKLKEKYPYIKDILYKNVFMHNGVEKFCNSYNYIKNKIMKQIENINSVGFNYSNIINHEIRKEMNTILGIHIEESGMLLSVERYLDKYYLDQLSNTGTITTKELDYNKTLNLMLLFDFIQYIKEL